MAGDVGVAGEADRAAGEDDRVAELAGEDDRAHRVGEDLTVSGDQSHRDVTVTGEVDIA